MARLIVSLAVLCTATVPAAGQVPPPGQNPSATPNWVDTITVGRLPTGGCEWSAVHRRLRPGNPGSTTKTGPTNEKTCTVLAYNYTTGSGREPPMVSTFVYFEDRKFPVPKNAVLNFADTFTVAQRPDGSCEWGRAPFRQGPRGSWSTYGEFRSVGCWGVVHNISWLVPPTQDTRGVKADTTELVASDTGSPRSPTAVPDAQAAVLKTFAKPDTIQISGTRWKGDSVWVTVRHTPETWTRYALVQRGGAWQIIDRVPGRQQ